MSFIKINYNTVIFAENFPHVIACRPKAGIINLSGANFDFARMFLNIFFCSFEKSCSETVLALLVFFSPNVKPVLHFVFQVRDTSLGTHVALNIFVT